MTIFCPQCWATATAEAVTCLHCGADLAADAPYDAKLARALRHPVAATRALAAEILGQRRVTDALPNLSARLAEENDMGALAALATALGRLGDERAVAPLQQRLSRPMPLPAALACVAALADLADSGYDAARTALAAPPPNHLSARVCQAWDEAQRRSRIS
jgi:HEAT repeat protein